MADTNAKELVECCFRDELPSFPVIADYVGNAESHEDITTVFGVYQGLVLKKDVDVELLNNCFHTNRLDELVHARFKVQPTGYYDMFKAANIMLKDPFASLGSLLGEEGLAQTELLPIYTDDQCPVCGQDGFITEGKRTGAECTKCLCYVCDDCFPPDGDGPVLCKKCK